jgi:hypothetical protein
VVAEKIGILSVKASLFEVKMESAYGRRVRIALRESAAHVVYNSCVECALPMSTFTHLSAMRVTTAGNRVMARTRSSSAAASAAAFPAGGAPAAPSASLAVPSLVPLVPLASASCRRAYATEYLRSCVFVSECERAREHEYAVEYLRSCVFVSECERAREHEYAVEYLRSCVFVSEYERAREHECNEVE